MRKLPLFTMLSVALSGPLLGCFEQLDDDPWESGPTIPTDPTDPTDPTQPMIPDLGVEPSQDICLNPTPSAPAGAAAFGGGGLDATGSATIQIHMEIAPAQVMVRDGATAAWQPATKLSPTSFEATVHGPYMVSVVCENVSVVQYLGHYIDEWETWQVGRTPDDAHDLVAPCVEPPGVNGMGGTMVQAGQVQLGEYVNSSTAPGWQVIEYPIGGTDHDLIATTASGIMVRRGVEVARFGETPTMPLIDVARDGALLTSAMFAAANATADEALDAAVHLATPTTATLAPIYQGPLAAVRVAPSAVLRPVDVQTVIVSATQGTSVRSLERAFRAGWQNTYTLPAPITGGQWAIAGGTALQTASWTALPALDSLVVHIAGGTASPATHARQDLDLSAAYLAATQVRRAAIDTSVPGYLDAWRLDLALPYTRTLSAQHASCHENATSSITETVAGTP